MLQLPLLVIAGLEPAIHQKGELQVAPNESFCPLARMDHRVKPGDDE